MKIKYFRTAPVFLLFLPVTLSVRCAENQFIYHCVFQQIPAYRQPSQIRISHNATTPHSQTTRPTRQKDFRSGCSAFYCNNNFQIRKYRQSMDIVSGSPVLYFTILCIFRQCYSPYQKDTHHLVYGLLILSLSYPAGSSGPDVCRRGPWGTRSHRWG